jgi:hypothetical protein
MLGPLFIEVYNKGMNRYASEEDACLHHQGCETVNGQHPGTREMQPGARPDGKRRCAEMVLEIVFGVCVR